VEVLHRAAAPRSLLGTARCGDFSDGSRYGYSSVYLELIEPERIHYRDAPDDWIFGLDGLPPAQLFTTISLDEVGALTTLTARVECLSVEARDQNISRGFTGMVSTGNDRLAEYLQTLTSQGGR